mmetsp:Transcript_29737/g.95916  ORF Transcript_29737/g.95916 Transcript_29737/m.95916 type:complete len:203 (-) Transcript_29737:228-836(-)
MMSMSFEEAEDGVDARVALVLHVPAADVEREEGASSRRETRDVEEVAQEGDRRPGRGRLDEPAPRVGRSFFLALPDGDEGRATPKAEGGEVVPEGVLDGVLVVLGGDRPREAFFFSSRFQGGVELVPDDARVLVPRLFHFDAGVEPGPVPHFHRSGVPRRSDLVRRRRRRLRGDLNVVGPGPPAVDVAPMLRVRQHQARRRH